MSIMFITMPRSPKGQKFLFILSALASLLLVWVVHPPKTINEAVWITSSSGLLENGTPTLHIQESIESQPIGSYPPGTVKPSEGPSTKSLIVAQTKDEDVDWIEENFGGDPNIRPMLYIADDFDAELHPPANKGHEVMIYLSYIIDHYYNLSDVNIFIHSHRIAWHNNEILGNDAVNVISRLSAERVQREGYMNLRCQWEPGCPDWIHPGSVEEDINKQEQSMLAQSWSEVFPLDPVPQVLAQPCCGQFALSRERIQLLPLAKYKFYRNWLLKTKLPDNLSGRVWEYMWQFVFTRETVWCPKEHVCNCDGFGVCFGSEEKYDEYYDVRKKKNKREDELRDWTKNQQQLLGKNRRISSELREAVARWAGDDTPEEEKAEIVEKLGRELPEEFRKAFNAEGSDDGYGKSLQDEINEANIWLDEKEKEAMGRGDVAMNRAIEVGREWHDGDGF